MSIVALWATCLNFWTLIEIAVILKLEQEFNCNTLFCPKGAKRTAVSVDPEHTATLGIYILK